MIISRTKLAFIIFGIAAILIAVQSSWIATMTSNQQSADPRIEKGFAIAPVSLNLQGRDRDLVGLGSYLVNAVGACNDCHTCPPYAPGHNPYKGGDGQINAANYLAGGTRFTFRVISRDLTPDPQSGKPADLDLDEFLHLMRSGEDPDMEHPHLGPDLKIMPWPIFRNMTDQDLRAIYEYLSAIPHAEPGSCGLAGLELGPDQ
ncbi:MAG: cytochrome C [Acidobacteria bacterium]|nr:cytochrome C [Acidobacteriota bacterium]